MYKYITGRLSSQIIITQYASKQIEIPAFAEAVLSLFYLIAGMEHKRFGRMILTFVEGKALQSDKYPVLVQAVSEIFGSYGK